MNPQRRYYTCLGVLWNLMAMSRCTDEEAIVQQSEFAQLHYAASEFVESFQGNNVVAILDANSSSVSQFWTSVLHWVGIRSIHGSWTISMVETVLDAALPPFGRFIVAMAFETVDHVPWEFLHHLIFYRQDQRLHIAILQQSSAVGYPLNTTDMHVEWTSHCDSRNVKGLALSAWYLPFAMKWIHFVPYPDPNRICKPTTAWAFDPQHSRTASMVKNFHRHPLTIATTPYPPFSDMTFSNDTYIATMATGADFDALKEISKRLNYTLDVRVTSDLEWGLDTGNGSWSGVIGMVQRREADLGCSALNAFPTHPPVVRYMEPWDEECVSIVTRAARPIETNILFKAFDPYPFWFWMIFWAILVVMTSMDFVTRKILGRPLGSWVTMCFMYFEASLGIGGEEKKITTHLLQRFIWMAWILFTMIVMIAYSTFLVSFLTIPLMEKLPESLEEFLSSEHNYKMIRVDWGDAVDGFLERSAKTSPVYGHLWQRLFIARPSDVWWDYSPMARVGGDRFGLIEMYSDGWTAVMLNGPESYVISKAKLICVPVGYAAPENGMLADTIDVYLRHLSRRGILRHMRKLSKESTVTASALERARVAKASGSKSGSEEAIVLRLSDLLSVFFILGVGALLGCTAFVVEIAAKFVRTLLMSEDQRST